MFAATASLAKRGRIVAMGYLRTETWPGNPAAPRAADQRQGTFDAYVPQRVTGWQPLLPADIAAFVTDAERRLSSTASVLAADSAPVAMFFWAESLGSSRMEGVNPRARRVVHAVTADAVEPVSDPDAARPDTVEPPPEPDVEPETDGTPG